MGTLVPGRLAGSGVGFPVLRGRFRVLERDRAHDHVAGGREVFFLDRLKNGGL